MDDRTGNSSKTSFADSAKAFNGVDASKIAELLAASSDVALVTDAKGIILDTCFKTDELFLAGARGWVGCALTDTVTAECEDKIAEMLEEVKNGKTLRSREINHAMIDGDDAPISYDAVKINNAGDVVFCGQNIARVASLQRRLMSSQLSMEREVSRLRNAENQYRATFQLSVVPQIIVESETLRISDANNSAARLLGESVQKLEGKKVLSLFDSDKDQDSVLHKFLLSGLSTTDTRETTVSLMNNEKLQMSVSHFPQGGKSYLLVQLQPDVESAGSFANPIERKVLALVDQMPDAFVVTDENRHITTANRAFCDLLNFTSRESIEGKLIDALFERPNVDCNVLVANIRKHNVVHRFASSLRTQYGQTVNVDIAACQLELNSDMVLGFWLRPANNLAVGAEVKQENVSRSNEQIANLVGHMPLKDIVRETTDMIEQLCIETALELTQNNRASAAQMLGVSRQSLYSKLGKDKTTDS